MTGRLLFTFSIGYGLGASLEQWPGSTTAAAVGLVIATITFGALYRETKGQAAG